jgi:alpha-L-fucosidase 2
MERRVFLKNTAIAASVASFFESFFPFKASGRSSQEPSEMPPPISSSSGATKEEIRSADYLRRAQSDKYLPKLPAFAESYQSPDVRVSPMPLTDRLKRKIVPRHGFCSIVPGRTVSEGTTSGNGAMNIEMTCDPYAEQILFHHESLLLPWRRPFEAPKVAHIFQQVRQMVMDGKYQEAIEFAFKEMEKGPIKANTWPHPTVPAFLMRLDFPKTSSVKNYLRTVNFESSEANVYWNDEHGDWLRQTFTSRPENAVVQSLTAPKGQLVNVRITLADSRRRMRPRTDFEGVRSGNISGESEIKRDFNEQRLIYMCRLDPSTDNSGYAGVVRVVRNGGSAKMEDGTLVVENASSVMLLTRIEWFADYSAEKVDALRQAVEQITPDYPVLLERHRKVQSEAFNRVTVDFGGASQYGMSTEELLADQRSREDYSPALLEKVFEMGRYWFMLTSGKYPTMVAEVNANINLQIAPGPQGDLREGMDAYFNWMESLAPDFRTNAKNIFGMRGTHYNL